MKQTIYKSGLSAILLLAGILTGCIKDDMSITNGTGEAAIEVQLQTYAVNSDSNAANEGELIVKSAHVFIFNEDDVLENAGNTVVGTTTSTGEVINASGTLNAKWKVNEGNKDIYIVTNPGEELAGRLSSMSATNGLTKSTLEAVLTNEANFATDVAGFSSNGMIMSGKVTAAAVSNTNTTVTVGVTRRHARIEFMLRKSKELEGSTVEVKSVKFKDQIRKTLVFPASAPTAATSDDEEKTMTTSITAQQATAGVWSGALADYTQVTSFYTFERAIGTKAACLEMVVSIDGKDYTLPVYICSTAIGTNATGNDENKPVALEANKIYCVMGTLGKQTTDITLDILDWNDVSVSGDILGAELAVSQSRILLDWYNFGGSFSTTVDLISNNNIDFLGYVYGYDPGTPAAANKSLSLPAWLPNSNISGLPDGTSKTANINLTYILHNTETSVFGGTRANIYLWFKAGNIYKCIEVIYDNSYIPYEVLKNCSVAWSTNTPAGVVFAKKGNYHPSHEFNTEDLYDQLVDEQRYIFASDVSTDVYTSDQYGTGFANTAAYIAALGANATGPNKCKSLGAEWYVPSLKEMETLRQLQGYLGTSYMMVPGSYWTSTASANAVGGKGNISLNYDLSEPSPQGVAIRYFTKNYFRCIMNHELLSIESTNLVADYWNWGKSFTKSVAFTSKDGAVTVKSIDNAGASKNWLTGAVISGDKVSITYQPTAGRVEGTLPSVHDDVIITLQTAGGTEKTITVKYDNGYMTADMLQEGGWLSNMPANGIHANKIGLVAPSGTAGNFDDEKKAWATVFTSVPEVWEPGYGLGYGTGSANTTAIITKLGAANAPAASACRTLGSEWYLPSADEMLTLYKLTNYMGPSYRYYTGTNAAYWSSTEAKEDTMHAWIRYANGSQGYGYKTYYYSVRCLRDM